jgi:hypothetical protein
MTKPIPDKAEVALDYPDKLYIGTFEGSSRFDAHLDQSGVSLTLERTGDAATRKAVRLHLHYALLADILRELAKTTSSIPPGDEAHRDALRAAAKALYQSLGGEPAATAPRLGANERPPSGRKGKHDLSKLTPEEEVLLLHVLE